MTEGCLIILKQRNPADFEDYPFYVKRGKCNNFHEPRNQLDQTKVTILPQPPQEGEKLSEIIVENEEAIS